jgi:hypothetical protein
VQPCEHPLVAAILAAWPGAVISIKRERYMIDATEDELDAIEAASDPAGEYLESIGKTDLATMTEEEWFRFLEVVVTGFQSGLAAIKERKLTQADAYDVVKCQAA